MDSLVRGRACELFGALSHPGRLKVVELLMKDGQRSVNEIAAALNVGQSSASQYLGQLTRAGVLVVEQRGSARLYRIRGPRIVRILELIEEFCQVHHLYGLEEEEAADGRPAGPHLAAVSSAARGAVDAEV